MQHSPTDALTNLITPITGSIIGAANVAVGATIVEQQLDLTNLPWLSFFIAFALAAVCGFGLFLHRFANGLIEPPSIPLKFSAHVLLAGVAGLVAFAAAGWLGMTKWQAVVGILIAGCAPGLLMARIDRVIDRFFIKTTGI